MHRLLYILLIVLLPGCTSFLSQTALPDVAIPHLHEFRQGTLIFHSDADVSMHHPLFVELASFPEQVSRALQLPISDRPIHIYLFKDRVSYETYLHREFKDIPSLRALFIKRPGTGIQKQDTLQVLAFWGDRIQDDLRHELTHATLHAYLHHLPLWLDEGLAMYFEVGLAAQGKHQRAFAALEPQLKNGTWKHDLERLESLKEVSNMGLADYYEAWAWVYYWMHSDPSYRTQLQSYLKERLSPTALPGPFPKNWSPLGIQPGVTLPEFLKSRLDELSSWPHG